MDSGSINSIIEEKYGGKDSGIKVKKGLDYLQKIVQLPFQIPTWKGEDISKSMSKIISKGLEGSDLVDQFEDYKKLIVEAVQPNPREVKRFINNVILAKAVFDKPVGELIAVRALDFRTDWKNFLELVSPDDPRKKFLNEYKKLKEDGRTITNEEDLDKLVKERSETDPLSKDIIQIYRELLKQGLALRSFLDAGAADILLRIEKMEELRRALDTAKLKPTKEEERKERVVTDELLKLLSEGEVQQFNEIVTKSDFSRAYLNFSRANLSRADLSSANLSSANLFDANLSSANLSSANLFDANLSSANLIRANLSGADLSSANLSRANLSGANLSDAILSSANLIRANTVSGLLRIRCTIPHNGQFRLSLCKPI